MSFDNIWNSETQMEWNNLFKKYWSLIKVDNIQIEYELNRLSIEDIATLNSNEWYDFLHDKYFVWKYTAKNRLATTRSHLQKYVVDNLLNDLFQIKNEIIKINHNNIKESLSTACKIKGLGVAGASGLLSLLYPKSFATVDQFVVKALSEVETKRNLVIGMNPESLTLKNGVMLTEIMKEKSKLMNRNFNTTFWTPRTIEMALWAYRS